jgi:hypothetical protein
MMISIVVLPWDELLYLVGPIVAAILAHAWITRRRP